MISHHIFDNLILLKTQEEAPSLEPQFKNSLTVVAFAALPQLSVSRMTGLTWQKEVKIEFNFWKVNKWWSEWTQFLIEFQSC